jgi:hypothetical protein
MKIHKKNIVFCLKNLIGLLGNMILSLTSVGIYIISLFLAYLSFFDMRIYTDPTNILPVYLKDLTEIWKPFSMKQHGDHFNKLYVDAIFIWFLI